MKKLLEVIGLLVVIGAEVLVIYAFYPVPPRKDIELYPSGPGWISGANITTQPLEASQVCFDDWVFYICKE